MDFLNDYFNYENKSTVSGLTNELNSAYIYNYFRENDNFVVVLTKTLYEANGLYQSLKNYTDDVCLFPADDFLASVALAVSPDLKVIRLETLNRIEESKKLIIVTHLMGYLKYLPNKNDFKKSILNLEVEKDYKREDIIDAIENMGYTRSSLVSTTGEYAVRGFIIDIFPIKNEHPIRVEFFGDTVDSIREFDEESQRSLKEIQKITIKQFGEMMNGDNSSLLDYIKNPFVFYINYDQIMLENDKIKEQIEEYNREKNIDMCRYMYEIEDLNVDNYILIDSIKNYGSSCTYESHESVKFSGDYEKFKEYCLQNVNKYKIVICLSNENQIKIISEMFSNISYTNPELGKITIIKRRITSGFIFKEYCFISEFDIDDDKQVATFKNPYRLGKKIKSFDDIKTGDYVVHAVNGIGVYDGIEAIEKNGMVRDYIKINYLGNDKIYIPVEKIDSIYKYSSADSTPPKINKLGSYSWTKTKNAVRKKIHDISESLIALYASRSKIKKNPYKYFEEEDIFASDFEFELTKDQKRCIEDILRDLEKDIPMDRLLCGDVGFGKTEVAFRAIYRAIMNGYQVSYLCPTTLLSRQHFNNAIIRFKHTAVNIALLNRYTTAKEVTRIYKELEEGKIDLVIGTHKLLNEKIKYKNLGLLVIDEEQRFGVTQKEKIKEIKKDVSVLTLSATPIPRTLKMAMSGLRDLSIIDTPPVNRYPVQTYVLEENETVIKDAIMKELVRDGQVFILYNKVESIVSEVDKIKRLIPEARVTFVHGKMDKETSEQTISDFVSKKYDVLVCTTIIETGIDIANVNTLIIIDAENFGLSQLYQLRGRVGRSDRIAYAYLMYRKDRMLNSQAVKRLDAIKDFTELGSGYKIAMRDLSIRGAGDLLGSEQAGFIDSVGIELYTQMVEQEMAKLNGEEVEEESVETMPLLEVANHIDDNYVSEEDLKIEIHQLINKITDEKSLEDIKSEIEDRFGTISSDMEIYMFEELFESLASKLDIFKVTQTQKDITITLGENLSNSIEGDKLFLIIYNINPKFKISYFAHKINIVLPITNLDRHFIYYEVKLLNELKLLSN